MSQSKEDGYEDLDVPEWDPTKISFLNHMIAGSIAGFAEHVCFYPIDTIKTHVQCNKCGIVVNSSSSWQVTSNMIRNEGVMRLWRGVSAMFAGCIPAHAAYFSVFEASKRALGADKDGHHPVQAAASGAMASISHDVLMTPFDLVKQRMQLSNYNSMYDCMKQVVRNEGFSALYVSFPTTLMMNIPYGCIMVAVNESAKKMLNPTGKYSFSNSIVAGCCAGAIAAALTTPLDVLKTRLQTQNVDLHCPEKNVRVIRPGVPLCEPSETISLAYQNRNRNSPIEVETVGSASNSSSSSTNRSNGSGSSKSAGSGYNRIHTRGMLEMIRVIIREDGYHAFMRGWLPRVLLHAPSTAISWTVYESIKSALI